jgi:ASPM-SPD-2-Hydin domain-containing protein/HYDIN/CFA65/VesB family protein
MTNNGVQPTVGVDLPLARTMCKTFGPIDNPPSQNSSEPGTASSSKTPVSNPQPSNASPTNQSANPTTTATGKPPVPTSTSATSPTSTVFLPVKAIHYKDWSPTSLGLFRELSWAVVAGTHIQATQNASTITELKCPADDIGNVVFSKTSSLSCDVVGEGLDKIATLRLENAQDATDTDTADGAVTVSGDPTKAKVTFPLAKLGNLNKPAYKVYAVTTTGVETFANQTLHFSLNPFESDLTPASADPNKQATIQFTVKGFHLDKVGKIELFEGTYSKTAKPFLSYDPDPGSSANQLSFTLKSTDDDLKKKATGTSGLTLQVAFTVKNSTTAITSDSIKLQSASTSAPGALTVSPKSLSFGEQNIGSVGSKDVQLVAGTLELKDLSVEITGKDAKVFSVKNTCSVTLQPNGKCTVSVKFSPKAAGDFAASLTINYNDGTSKQAESVNIMGKAADAVSDAVSLSPKNMDFGTQIKGVASSVKTVTLTNSGAVPLSGFKVTLSSPGAGSFNQSNKCGDTVEPGKKCELEITFKPAAVGKISTTLNVSYMVSDKKHTQSLRIVGAGKD